MDAIEQAFENLTAAFNRLSEPQFIRDYILYRNTEYLKFEGKENLHKNVESELDAIKTMIMVIDQTLLNLLLDNNTPFQKEGFTLAWKRFNSLQDKFSENLLQEQALLSPFKELVVTQYQREVRLYKDLISGLINGVSLVIQNYDSKIKTVDVKEIHWEDLPLKNWFKSDKEYQLLIDKLVENGWCYINEEQEPRWQKNTKEKMFKLSSREKRADKLQFVAFAITLCEKPHYKKFLKFSPNVIARKDIANAFNQHFRPEDPVSKESFQQNREAELKNYLEYFEFLKELEVK